MTKIKTLSRLLFILILLTSCGASQRINKDYAEEMKNSLRVLQWDLSKYSFRTTPLGSFGVGTIYMNEKNSTDPKIVENSWLLSNKEIWFKKELSDDEKNDLLKRIIIEGNVGNFGIENKENISTKASVALPLFEVLNMSAKLNSSKKVKVNVSASKAVNRRLVWPEFVSAINGGNMSKNLEDIFSKGDFIISAADIIVEGFKVTVEVDKSFDPEIEAKLSQYVGKTLGKGTEGKIKIKKKTDGVFEFEASENVIVANLFKFPPKTRGGNNGIRGLSQLPDIETWPNTLIDIEKVGKLDNYFEAIGTN